MASIAIKEKPFSQNCINAKKIRLNSEKYLQFYSEYVNSTI